MNNPPNPAVALLPCPSGHSNTNRDNNNIYGAWWVKCADCSWRTAGDTEADAIAAWNTRQSNPVAAGVGEGLREAFTPSDAQVEHVAKALYDAAHAGLSNCYAWDDAWEDYQEARRGRYYRDAKAAIPAVIAALSTPPEDLHARDALLLGGDAMRGEGL